jgi:putative hydrolase of the HAD superfamily
MPIGAILFDLDNTLLLEDDATEEALRRTSELAGRRTGAAAGSIHAAAREAAESLFAASPLFAYSEAMGIWWGEALWGDFAGDRKELAALRAFVPGFRRAVWSHALRAAAVDGDGLADDLAIAFADIRRALRPIDPEAEATLADLGRDHRLALVTNGAPDVQREKLATTTLAVHFAAIVISVELGIGKPDPRIFGAALDAVGVGPEAAVMVGDSLERDIAGARRAGLRAVWLDRTGDGTRDGAIVPDARIGTLGELRSTLTALERADPFPQPA